MNRLLVSAPLFVGLLGLSACSSEEAIPTDIKVDPIEWSTCEDYPDDETLECGVLEVPLDYSDLEGETIEISLIRIPATSSKPKGVVLSNPGGPGESGVDFISSWSVEFVENLGLEDFDIVGWDVNNVYENAGILRELLKNEKRKYKQIRRQLQRKTYGSLWRVVVNPIDEGWDIQVRQFFITRPKAKRPVTRTRKSSTPIFLQSAPTTNFSATMTLLGQFVRYPSGLLTSYAELTASVFHSRNNLRLSNATGCLYKRGRIRKPKVEEAPNFVPFIP
jgi:hypothetical protein